MSTQLKSQEFLDMIKSWEYKVYDLRTEDELNRDGYIEWTDEFLDYTKPENKQKMLNFDKEWKYLLYCTAWLRSLIMATNMKWAWFENVFILSWWVNSWIDDKLELIK